MNIRKSSRFFIALPLMMLMFFTTNCGEVDESQGFGDSSGLKIKTYPTSPLVIHADRNIILPGFEGVITHQTLLAPNMQLKLEIDNKTGDRTITILLAHLIASGPKGPKNLYVGPDTLFETRESGGEDIQFPALRGYLVQVRPGRKTSCMEKVAYLELPSDTSSCPADLEEGTFEDGSDPSMCCPTGSYSLAKSWLYIPKLQDMDADELADPGNVFQSYTFELTLIGWFGGANFPEANLRKKHYFTSNGL